MTRVLMTTDAVGGVWGFTLELADALVAEAIEVHVAVLGPPMTRAQRAQAQQSSIQTLHEWPGALEWMDEPWPDVQRSGDWLLDLAAQLAPDLVHLNGYAHAALEWRVPTVVGAHSDVVSWWRAVHDEAPPARWNRYAQRVREGLEAADAVVAPTRAALTDLEHSFGFTGGSVIPNGRRRDWVRPVPKQPLVLAAGRVWDPAKNLAAVVAAAPRIPWPTYVAGDDGGAGDAPGTVQLLGRLAFPDLAEWLLRAAVFAAPAWYEPFGLAPLEAGLAGCALVLGDIDSLREVWGDAARYVAPGDPEELARAVTELVGDGVAVRELGERARTHARRYTPAATAAGYAALYHRLTTRVAAG